MDPMKPGIDWAAVDARIAERLDGWMDELASLCRQPSVSARHEGIEDCARLVAGMLERRGFSVELTAAGGNPVVLARATGRNSDRTLLCYNHYDVQPPEPLEQWVTGPFEPSIRDGALYARGAKDDKGDFLARLAALDALRDVTGDLPCRVIFLVEGEEEIGSPNLPAWVDAHLEELRADASIWEEGGVDSAGHPLLALGARGLLYVELSVQALAHDAHSGGANLVPSAAWRLVWALATLKDREERVLIPGFYDGVRSPTEAEERLLDRLPSEEEALKRDFGLSRLLLGRTGSMVPRAPWEPTCNIAGIGSGYQGPGSKTIVPALATAKVDFRLVPGQDPHDIAGKLRTHLDSHGFQDVSFEILGAERPGLTSAEEPFVRLAAETGLEVYGKPARLVPLNGGTTPKYLFTERGVPVVAPGVGYPGSRVHSPNEHVRLRDFELAARHLARLIGGFGAAGP